jgi:hypothetical protein
MFQKINYLVWALSAMVSPAASPQRTVILYSNGGLSDVGRHAVLAALEKPVEEISSIAVVTPSPVLLEEPNWKCGCPNPHSFTEEQKERFTVIPISSWKFEEDSDVVISKEFTEAIQSATTIISCLGNRQTSVGGWCAYEGNQAIMKCLRGKKSADSLPRVILFSSMGIEEDWPPLQGFMLGRTIMSLIFTTCGREAYKDLSQMERLYRGQEKKSGDNSDALGIEYCIIRPMGLGEDVVPVGAWATQSPDRDGRYLPWNGGKISLDFAKMDCARYLISEALVPTLVCGETVYVGGVPKVK